MIWCHNAIIVKGLLSCEKLALTATGQTTEIAALYNDSEQDGLIAATTTTEAGGQQSRRTARCTIGRLMGSIIGLVVVLGLESVYYVVHYLTSDEDRTVFNKGWFLEFVLIFLLISFYFCAPLHRRLLSTSDPHSKLEELIHDAGSRFMINATLVCAVSYLVGDFLFFQKHISNVLSTQIIYICGIVINIATFYGSFLLIILTIRVILIDLDDIEGEVDAALEQATASGRYNTFNGEQEENRDDMMQMWGSWMESYQRIRHSMHDLSERFGPRMFAAIFFFLVNVSTGITLLFGIDEEHADGEDGGMDLLDGLFLFLMFGANSIILVLTVFTLGFTVTKCGHYVGPKLAMLSMSAPDPIVHRTHALASTFILAPIRVHVGNFEFSPEYANFVALWLVALFLVVLGLTAPGSE